MKNQQIYGWNKGKKWSEETRRKMSLAHRKSKGASNV